jgi:hypothetical protein
MLILKLLFVVVSSPVVLSLLSSTSSRSSSATAAGGQNPSTDLFSALVTPSGTVLASDNARTKRSFGSVAAAALFSAAAVAVRPPLACAAAVADAGTTTIRVFFFHGFQGQSMSVMHRNGRLYDFRRGAYVL